jgi:hypothetical protein
MMPITRAARVAFVSALIWPAAQQAQATARTAANCARTGEYVDVSGADTIGVSFVTITDSSVASTSRAVAQGAVFRFRGQRGTSGEITSLHTEVWPPGADTAGAPGQVADLRLTGTELTVRVAAPTRGMQVQRDRMPAGGVLYMSSVSLFLELLQRRGSAAVGQSTIVPVLWLFSGGAVDTVRVSRVAADSVSVRFPTMEFALRLAPDGSILRGHRRTIPDVASEASELSRRDCR